MWFLSLLGFAIAFSSAARFVFSPLQELAKADLSLTDFQLSLVQGLAASIPIAFLSIPIGRLVDRVHRVRLLLGMIAISVIGTLLTVVAESFWFLFMARMLAGLGAVCAIPVAISLVADLSRPEMRGRAVLYLSVGNIAGGAFAFAAGGWLLGFLRPRLAGTFLDSLAPWRAVHIVFAAAGAIVFLAILMVREPARRELGDAVGATIQVAASAIWARRRLLLPLCVGYVTSVMADTAAAIWAAPVLSRSYHQSPEAFAGWMGLVILVSGIAGSVIGGVAADFGQRSRMRGGIAVGAVIAALISVPAAFFALMPTVPLFAVSFGIFLLCGTIMGLTTVTVIAVLIPNELRGICLGALLVVGSVIGFALAPTLVSLISGALGGEAHLASALSVVSVVTSSAALIGFLMAARAIADIPIKAT